MNDIWYKPYTVRVNQKSGKLIPMFELIFDETVLLDSNNYDTISHVAFVANGAYNLGRMDARRDEIDSLMNSTEIKGK